jgi:glycosyltransferase involved in cell wall biosynthesis
MNIWMFNHYAVAPGGHGGTRHYDLARELTKQGCEVKIFASSFPHQGSEDKMIPEADCKVKEVDYEGVRFIWLKTRAYFKNDWRRVFNILDYTVRAYRAALKQKDTPDVIIGSLMHPLAAWLGYVVAKKKKCLFYFEERDLWPQTLLDFGKVSRWNPVVTVLSALELFLYKKAKRIVLLFDKAADYVEQRGINREKVFYLPNGVDLSRFDAHPQPLPEELERSLAELKGKFIAIYTGSHSISDHLDGLLDTAGMLQSQREICFLFVGDGLDKKRLVERAEKMGLDNVYFLPPIAKELIPSLLARGDIGLISLKNAEVYKWGLSFNKLYDYMAASLPTIFLTESTDLSIIRSGITMASPSPQTMAEDIRALYQNEQQRSLLGKRVRDYVEGHHSWKVMSRNLLDVMTKDLEGKQ